MVFGMSFAPPRPSSQKLQEPLLSVTQVSIISTAPAASLQLCCWHSGGFGMCQDGGTALVLVFPTSDLFAHLRHLKKKTNTKNHGKDRASEHYPAFPRASQWSLDHVSFPCLLEGCGLVVLPVMAQPCWAPLADTHRLRALCQLGTLLPAQAGFWFESE